MFGQHRWLRGEIEAWREDGLIDQSLAATLLERYPLSSAERGWGRLVFSAIGAILIGLGVILFFAYNWEELPKAAKLFLVASGLLASHGAGLWLARSGKHPRSLSEGMHVIGTMMFGAGIWLVAQIYHIDEHYPNAVLVWSLGALALAWALPSLTQGLLAVVLICIWSLLEIFDFQWSADWAPLLILRPTRTCAPPKEILTISLSWVLSPMVSLAPNRTSLRSNSRPSLALLDGLMVPPGGPRS